MRKQELLIRPEGLLLQISSPSSITEARGVSSETSHMNNFPSGHNSCGRHLQTVRMTSTLSNDVTLFLLRILLLNVLPFYLTNQCYTNKPDRSAACT